MALAPPVGSALTLDAYDRLVEDGGPHDAPVKLLDGRLVPVSPQGHVHAEALTGCGA